MHETNVRKAPRTARTASLFPSLRLVGVFFFFFFSVSAIAEVKVHFIIDEDLLAMQTIAKSRPAHGRFAEHVEAYRTIAKKMDPAAVAAVQLVFEKEGTRVLFQRMKTKFASFARRLRQTPQFSRILAEVKEYAAACRAEWEKNLPATEALMKSVTLLPFTKEVHVFIMHPAVGSGTTWDQEKHNISFGAYPAWNNYFTVYIWHELLHLELPDDDAAHSLIQLATDCWLRQQLNGVPYPPFEGHEELFPQMQRLLPKWTEYLQHPDGILKFYKRIPKAEKNCDGQPCER